MGKYLKKFENHTQYENYINGSGAILPNVSLCVNENEVHYNPWVETRLVTKFNVTDTSSPTQIASATTGFNEIEIDGVIQENISTGYTFNTTGEHTIKYTLSDPTTIGNSSLRGCTALTSIEIPDNVTSIGDYAFRSCSGLTSINIPSGVTSIGQQAFRSCSGLTSINIPSGVTSIGGMSFDGCSSFTSIDIPNSVTSIGNQAFSNCSSLTSINIPSGVTSIGNGVFYNCYSLSSINIPDSVTSIGNNAFNGCSSLSSINIPSGVTSIGQSAFANCTSLPVENDIRYADTYAVEAANKVLITYTLSNNTKWIGDYAFDGCSGLTSIDIPNSVTSIGQSAFHSCSGLTSCTIGSGVTSIGPNAFQLCRSLASITCNATTAPTIQSSTFNYIKNNGTLYVPIGSSGYDVWMGTGNYYLGHYNWTKVEQ